MPIKIFNFHLNELTHAYSQTHTHTPTKLGGTTQNPPSRKLLNYSRARTHREAAPILKCDTRIKSNKTLFLHFTLLLLQWLFKCLRKKYARALQLGLVSLSDFIPLRLLINLVALDSLLSPSVV